MIVGNRYELHDMVAQGAYGMVFRATDTRHNKPVAVKMLSGGAKQDPHVVERLVREQQALQALSGTNAVGAIDLCRAQTGALCLVMEWLEGVDMEQHFESLEEQGTPMSQSELLGIVRPVLDTLEKAHELGIVHRDIKPANIFLLSEGKGVRLLDFGLSRLKSSATLTAVGMVMGSPSYMAPEAWKGNSKAIGRQADLYSVGVIVFRALTGKVPFDTDALVEKMRMVTTAKRPSIRARRPDLPLVIDTWAERALAIDPAVRFQHAAHFLESLEAALAGLPLPKHTIVIPSRGVTSIPPPKTTEEERENAVSAALSRAASLLKRFASGFSRGPTPGATQRNPETSKEAAPAAVLPKPPAIAPAPKHHAPVVPPPPATAEKKTIHIGDDELVDWLLEDDASGKQVEQAPAQAGPLDVAPTSLDARTEAALTPPPPAPAPLASASSVLLSADDLDDDWDAVTLPRAQRILPDMDVAADLSQVVNEPATKPATNPDEPLGVAAAEPEVEQPSAPAEPVANHFGPESEASAPSPQAGPDQTTEGATTVPEEAPSAPRGHEAAATMKQASRASPRAAQKPAARKSTSKQSVKKAPTKQASGKKTSTQAKGKKPGGQKATSKKAGGKTQNKAKQATKKKTSAKSKKKTQKKSPRGKRS